MAPQANRRGGNGLGQFAPYANVAVVVVFLAVFYLWQERAWTLFREQTAEIRSMASAVRDMAEEIRRDRESRKRYGEVRE